MIKYVIVIIVLLISTTCFAPELNSETKDFQKKICLLRLSEWNKEKELSRFKNDIGFRESTGNWKIINDIGCMGTYQFMASTLDLLGYKGITPEKFKKNPDIFPPEKQDSAFMALVRLNEIQIKELESYLGKEVKGVEVTKSGLLAALHLGGIVSVIEFLTTDKNPHDIYGTSISDYMSQFAGYNI